VKGAAWIGFFFFVALVLLGFSTLLVGDLWSMLQSPTYLDVHFEKVQGLRERDDVRVDGVLMGKVHAIRLHPSSGVVVRLRMQEPVAIFRDGVVEIDASSVLGGSYVSIRRGSKAPPLDLGQPLPGKTKPGLDEFGELASENRENFRQLIANLKDVTGALKDGKGSVGKALTSDELHKKVVEAVDEIKKTGETAQKEIKRVGDNLEKITEKIDKGQGPVPALLNDKKMTEKVDRTLSEVETAATNLRKVAEKIDHGDGVLAKLVNDKEMGDRLKRTVENVEKTSESLKQVTGKLESGEGSIGKLLQDDELYEKARRTLDDMDRTLGRAARSIVEVVVDSKSYNESEMTITKLGIRISPDEDKYFFIGAAFLDMHGNGDVLFEDRVDDDSSTTEIKGEVQIGYRVPWFFDRRITVRGGLIEGRPGAGMDVRWDDWLIVNHPVFFSVEARDAYNDLDEDDIDEEIDGAMVRAFVRTPLWTRKANWFEMLISNIRLFGGVNRIGEDPEAVVGLGYEWTDQDIRTLVSLVGIAR
jgi:phospholipid/cholesterol/gamma-HCH transport system substrate-binding protein